MQTLNQRIPRAFAALAACLRNLGALPTALYIWQRMRIRLSSGQGSLRLHSKHARHPVQCRIGTSDWEVFTQMFVQREYRCLDELADVDLIIDCGANVGLSAAYFLSRFSASTVICIEPDVENFEALQRNLTPYEGRTRALCSAVWPYSTGLVISEDTFGDGREWARTVREARPGESATVEAVDIGSLIESSGRQRVSILKIDVEGAEEFIFGANRHDWLDRVDNLVIELHGERCEKVFHDAIAGRGFTVSRCDELTVCKRADDYAVVCCKA
jgi:FkbM family methyltransferase